MRKVPLSLWLSLAALMTAVAAFVLRSGPSPGTDAVSPADSVARAARDSYALLDPQWRQRGDREALLDLHGEEMRRTFEVAGAAVGDSVSVAFLRYSIGPRVYHDVQWLRRVGSGWHPTADLSARKSAPDPFGDGKAEEARKVIDSATQWLKEGAPRWW